MTSKIWVTKRELLNMVRESFMLESDLADSPCLNCGGVVGQCGCPADISAISQDGESIVDPAKQQSFGKDLPFQKGGRVDRKLRRAEFSAGTKNRQKVRQRDEELPEEKPDYKGMGPIPRQPMDSNDDTQIVRVRGKR